VSFEETFSVSHLLLPDRQSAHTRLLDLTPLSKACLQNDAYEQLYNFTHFNPVQTQCFHVCYHSDYNVLMGAPTGSGKTIVAELCLFRLFNEHPGMKAIYVAPLKALSRERMLDWGERIGRKLGRTVVELTGDFTPDVSALAKADVIVTTPEKWDGISRHWQHRNYVTKVGLVIIDEIHLLGQDRGPILEVIVSRMRYISVSLDYRIRFCGLSTALANAHDIADWLGIGVVGLYNFPPSVRPVPMTVHIQGYPEKHYCPRMATMNKPTFHAIQNHSPEKPVLVFVASRRQTRLTAQDLLGFIKSDSCEDPKMWAKNMDPNTLLYHQARCQDPYLKEFIEFGIGIHHAGLTARDREIVEALYLEQKIMVLIATSTLAWGVNFPAHLVVVKGTEFFDPQLKRYVDFPITDVLQMMGRAGRPQFDDHAVSVVMVHEPKKNFYRRFLYEPFPVESSLHEQLTDHINAEICAKTITNKDEAVDYVTWTYFFRRLTANPAYYDQFIAALEDESDANPEKFRSMLSDYLDRLINKCFDELLRSSCIEIGEQEVSADGEVLPPKVTSTAIGKIASLYYLGHRTVAQFSRTLSREPLNFVAATRVLCECPQYEEVPVRHNEDKLCAEWAEKLPIEIDLAQQAYDSPHTKAFLLLQAHMWGVKVPIADFQTDMKSVLDQSIRIIQSMVDIAAYEAQLKSAMNMIMLLQCIHQATHPWRSSLRTLPHISDTIEQELYNQGITSLPELIERQDVNRVIGKLHLSAPNAHKELIRRVKGLPLLRVSFELRIVEPSDEEEAKDLQELAEGRNVDKPPPLTQPYNVPPGCDLELTVNLKYGNVPEKYFMAAKSEFTKKKTFSWWVLLGDLEVDELVDVKRVMMPAKRGFDRRAVFSFNSPGEEDGETFKLSVIVCSDSYYGLDQQYDIDITTTAGDGGAPPEGE